MSAEDIKELEDYKDFKARLAERAKTSRKVAQLLREIEEDEQLEAEEEAQKINGVDPDEIIDSDIPPYQLPLRRKRLKQTFLNMGEAEPWEEDGMLDDDHDDITTLAHGELEQHREMRHYARLAAWEMPLLSSMWSPAESCLS